MVDVGQSPDPPSGQQPKSLSTRTSTSRCTLDKNHLYSSSTSTAPPSSALAPGGATPIIDDDNGRLSAAPITATAHSTRAGHLDAASHESTPLIETGLARSTTSLAIAPESQHSYKSPIPTESGFASPAGSAAHIDAPGCSSTAVAYKLSFSKRLAELACIVAAPIDHLREVLLEHHGHVGHALRALRAAGVPYANVRHWLADLHAVRVRQRAARTPEHGTPSLAQPKNPPALETASEPPSRSGSSGSPAHSAQPTGGCNNITPKPTAEPLTRSGGTCGMQPMGGHSPTAFQTAAEPLTRSGGDGSPAPCVQPMGGHSPAAPKTATKLLTRSGGDGSTRTSTAELSTVAHAGKLPVPNLPILPLKDARGARLQRVQSQIAAASATLIAAAGKGFLARMHQHATTRQAMLCYKTDPEHRSFDSSGTLRWLQHSRQRPSPRTSESSRRRTPPSPHATTVDSDDESYISDNDEQRAGALFAAASTETTNDSTRRSPSPTRRSPSPTSRSPSPGTSTATAKGSTTPATTPATRITPSTTTKTDRPAPARATRAAAAPALATRAAPAPARATRSMQGSVSSA